MRCPILRELPPPPPGKVGWPWTEEGPQLPDTLPDGQPWPRISIVTPSYNQGQFIEQTIRSVLLQGFPNLEYIVIDGGSTDQSVEIIRRYSAWLSHWVSEPDSGQSAAINKGFSRATGELFAWLNSDDWYMPAALPRVAQLAMTHSGAMVLVGAGRLTNQKGEIIIHKEPPPTIDLAVLLEWLNGGDFIQPSCFFTRAAWDRIGRLDESLHLAFDVDLWIRMAKSACPFVTTDAFLANALAHENAKTSAFQELSILTTAVVIINHGGAPAVLGYLEEMNRNLTYYKTNLNKILNNPIIRIMRPVLKLFVKPAVSWQDALPPWSTERKEHARASKRA